MMSYSNIAVPYNILFHNDMINSAVNKSKQLQESNKSSLHPQNHRSFCTRTTCCDHCVDTVGCNSSTSSCSHQYVPTNPISFQVKPSSSHSLTMDEKDIKTMYDSAMWRMYNRITEARRASPVPILLMKKKTSETIDHSSESRTSRRQYNAPTSISITSNESVLYSNLMFDFD